MTPNVPPHELLLFIAPHFTTSEAFENKKGDFRQVSADMRTHPVCWSGLLLQLLSLLVKHPWKLNSENRWEIIRARHFIEVKLGYVNTPVEYTTSVNPYLFSLATNLN